MKETIYRTAIRTAAFLIEHQGEITTTIALLLTLAMLWAAGYLTGYLTATNHFLPDAIAGQICTSIR